MSEFIVIGQTITLPALRDYIIDHRIDQGDTLVVNPVDYHEIIHEVKTVNETLPDFPLKLLSVLIVQDTTDTVPIGKLQIIKNDKPF